MVCKMEYYVIAIYVDILKLINPPPPLSLSLSHYLYLALLLLLACQVCVV